MNSTINHDADCFVHQLNDSSCFVCLSEEQKRDVCNYAKHVGFLLDVFCTHPDRDGFQRKPISKNNSKRPYNSFSTSE